MLIVLVLLYEYVAVLLYEYVAALVYEYVAVVWCTKIGWSRVRVVSI